MTEAGILYRKAAKQLKKKQSKGSSLYSETSSLRLLQELNVHQLELEIQNEQLRLAKVEAKVIELNLKERIKELNGIYSLGHLADKSEVLEDIYNEFVNIIVPKSMQFPEKVIVSLEIEGKRYCNIKNVRPLKTQIYLSAPVIIFKKNRGELIVAYTKDIAFIDTFEQQLINNFAGRISKITERIETKQALKESEASLRNAQEIAKMGSWERDMVTKKIYWSENLYSILGFNSALDKPTFELIRNRIHPDDVHSLDEAYTNIMIDKQPFSFQLRFIQPDGSIKWIHHSINPVIEEDKLIKLKGVIIDITESRQKDEEIKKINESLEKLSYRLIQIREEERAAISRDIHDQIGQALTALKFDTVWLFEQNTGEPEVVAKLNGMIDMITETILNVQRIASELRPPMLDDIGLAAAVEWYCEEFVNRTGLKINMELERVQSENMNINLSVYRVLQESLTNILRHAGAKNVEVKLSRIKNELVLIICDDGIGISPEKLNSPRSLGILGMMERIRYSGGLLEIAAPEKGGTQIRVKIQLEK
jgi:two-component system sensor histidine kinase UhpB